MVLRRDPNGYGVGGWSYFVECPEDLAALPARARRLVDQRAIALWSRHPEEMKGRAESCSFGPLARWLSSLTRAPATLEVHCPSGGPASSVLVRFAVEPRTAQAGGWSPAIEPAKAAERPPVCPARMLEVYENVGGINLQYACSRFLVAPRDVYTARDLVKSTWERTPPDLREHAFYGTLEDYAHVDLERALSLWEADGDVLFYTPDGSTFWLGHEHYAGEAGAPWLALDDALERIFDALCAHRSFHAD